MLIWLEFTICLLLITVAGVKLSYYGDVIAEKTGLGGTVIGLVMMATVTSLPELVTGISSVTVADVPDIAVGDVLGSCVFNLVIIVALDFLYSGEPIYSRASHGQILVGTFGLLLIGFAGLNIVASTHGLEFALAHVGFYSPAILVLYIVALQAVYRYELDQIKEFTSAVAERYPDLTLGQTLVRYTVAALVVMASGVALPFVAKSLAIQMGWSQSFVGTLLVAFATSLPEVVVTVAALRLGALDMALSNLLGSNLFNILILAVDDVLYLKGPLLSNISPVHAVSALSAVTMTGVAIGGILYRPHLRVFKNIGWASLVLFALYVLNSVILYLY